MMSPKAQFTEGTAIWLKDEEHCWLKAVVKEFQQLNPKKFLLKCQMDDIKCGNFEVREIKFSENDSLPFLRNTTLNEDGLDDLTSLSHLNDPAVLNTIQYRYQENLIYTYSGLVLVSLNPYCDLGLYGDGLIQAYCGKSRGELEPHLFAVAEDAFRSMQRDQKNQSIIISGESGAGKTISARYVMRYFASAANSHLSNDNATIESRVLASNPILEAFGNAKTTRNDNSSRFGKYVQIFFDNKDEIIGAAIKTYLLEKTRVIKQSPGERNYHVFYQLLEGSNEDLKKKLFLDSSTWKDFEYLKAAGGAIENVNDSEEFGETVKSMKIAGFSDEIQVKIFKILSAILHLGNLKFQYDSENFAILSETDENLIKFAQLLDLDATEKTSELAKWFTCKQLITKLESVEIKLTVKQAESSRDAVSKFLYSKVFDFIVKQLNELLQPTHNTPAVKTKFIGVLDIYGFEKFDQNSFEQFCINYANEKLQHEFNQQVFKLEQELYEREKIEWSFINFSDNQPCIDLIEIRGGILDLLDEECRFPNGGDESFLDKIKSEIPKKGDDISKYLGKDPLEIKGTFTIKHFAYDVSYSVEGFLEKNRDLIPSEIIQIIETDTSSLITKKSTGSAFRDSLRDLMKIIQSTQVHYIRCIKPNNSKAAMTFEPNFVLQQLRAGGIIETIKISAAGYPARWSFEEFFSRYSLLDVNIGNSASPDYKELSSNLLKGQVDYLKDGEYQIGRTQIFLRAGILAKLEKIRTQTLKNSACLIQSQLRGIWAVESIKRQLKQIVLIQSTYKAKRDTIRVEELRKNQAAILLQSAFKYHVAISGVEKQIDAIKMIQIQLKSRFRKTIYAEELRHRMILKIQNVYRAKKDNLIKNLKNYSAKQVQSSFKRFSAIQELKQLRIEAKSFEKLQETSLGLEKKVVEMTRELEAMNVKNQEIYTEIGSRDQKINILEKEIESFKSQIVDIEDLKSKIVELESEHVRSLAELKSLHEEEVRQLRASYETQLTGFNDSNGSLQVKYRELLESKGKLELKFAKVEHYVRTLMANHVISKNPDLGPDSEPEIGSASANGNEHLFDLMGSHNSLINFISEEEDSKLIKFTSSTGVLEDLLSSESILDELMAMIRSASVEVNENESEGFVDVTMIMKPARIIYSWLSVCLTLPLLADLTEHRMNLILETIRVTLSESTDDKKCSLWLTNLIHLYGMIHHFICEKEAEVQRNHSKIRNSGDTGENIKEDTDTKHPESADTKNCEYIDTYTARPSDHPEYISPALTSTTTQISVSELPPALIILIRAEVMRLIGDIYSAWLKELCRWFAKAGVSGILEYQPLPNYKVKGGVNKERRSFVEKLTTLINDHNGQSSDTSPQSFSINELLDALDDLLEAFLRTTLDLEIVQSILLVIYRHMSITCFNQLLLKRNFISWKRAIQIQFNLSRLEDWCRERLGAFGIENEAFESFGPLLQAVKVIQLAKTRGVDTGVLQQCAPDLSPLQIRKLLTNYVPDDFEDGPVPLNLIRQFPAGTTTNNVVPLLPQLDLNKLTLPVGLKERNPPNAAGIANELPIDMPPTLWKLFVLYLK